MEEKIYIAWRDEDEGNRINLNIMLGVFRTRKKDLSELKISSGKFWKHDKEQYSHSVSESLLQY